MGFAFNCATEITLLTYRSQSVTCLTAVWEDRGSNPIVHGSCRFIVKTTTIYSLGHGLHSLTAVPRSTQPSTLRGMVKWVSAFKLSTNKWRWWVWILAAYRRTHSPGLVVWPGLRVGGWGCAARSTFITWTGWTLAVALSYDDSTINVVVIIIIIIIIIAYLQTCRLVLTAWLSHRGIQALLALGSSANYQDTRGLTPLYYCVSNAVNDAQSVACMEALLYDHATVDSIDNKGCTPLHQVCTLYLISPRAVWNNSCIIYLATRRRSWECISPPSGFLQTPLFGKCLTDHVRTVPGNMRVKFERI